jgi:two-component system, NarL family, invasion response regulator UvrY
MNVLLVDDSELLRERLIGLVSDIGGVKVVGSAGNTLDGLAETKKLNPDLVIADISMPGGGGIKLLKQIKALNKNIKVVVLTNYPHVEYKEKCKELGADYFYSKIKDMDSMLETLKKLSAELKINSQDIT